MSYNVFLDDERMPVDVTWLWLPKVDWAIARNIEEFKTTILLNGMPSFISFDNDLGKDEPQGRDCARWLVDMWMDNVVEYNPNFNYAVHSRNTVAGPWIVQYINAYMDQR